MANLWAYDAEEDRWVEIYQEQRAVKVLMCGLNDEGELTPVLVDDTGKVVTTTG